LLSSAAAHDLLLAQALSRAPAWPSHRTHGDRSCSGRRGCPAPRGRRRRSRPSRADRSAGPAASARGRASRGRRRARPGRDAAGNFDSRCRARVRSPTRSARARHRSPTACSAGVGMWMATSSPARGAAAPAGERGASRAWARRRERWGSARARSPGSRRPCCAAAGPARSRLGRCWEQARSRRGSPRRPTSLRTDGSSWHVRSTSGSSWSGARIATEMVLLWTSSPRWVGPRWATLATAGSFRMWLRPRHRG
jgi:hypothetical protein